MKKYLSALALFICFTAFGQLKISQYPNTTAPDLKFMFIFADTNSVPGTNWNYTFGSLSNFIYSLTTNISSGLSGTTNFMNLSVQAAKLPNTNYPAIDASYQDWELQYYKTNNEGFVSPQSASWQFVVPPDYATNSLKVRLLSTLMSTNGPNTSNTIFRASCLRVEPSGSTDVRGGSFGTQVSGTNTWTQSTSNTNKPQSLVIDLGTSSLLAPGDLCILAIDRNVANDTFGGASALVGLQIEYQRP